MLPHLVAVKGHARTSAPMEDPGKPPAPVLERWAQVGARRDRRAAGARCSATGRGEGPRIGAGEQGCGSGACVRVEPPPHLTHGSDTGETRSRCCSWAPRSHRALARGEWGRGGDDRVREPRVSGFPARPGRWARPGTQGFPPIWLDLCSLPDVSAQIRAGDRCSWAQAVF